MCTIGWGNAATRCGSLLRTPQETWSQHTRQNLHRARPFRTRRNNAVWGTSRQWKLWTTSRHQLLPPQQGIAWEYGVPPDEREVIRALHKMKDSKGDEECQWSGSFCQHAIGETPTGMSTTVPPSPSLPLLLTAGQCCFQRPSSSANLPCAVPALRQTTKLSMLTCKPYGHYLPTQMSISLQPSPPCYLCWWRAEQIYPSVGSSEQAKPGLLQPCWQDFSSSNRNSTLGTDKITAGWVRTVHTTLEHRTTYLGQIHPWGDRRRTVKKTKGLGRTFPTTDAYSSSELYHVSFPKWSVAEYNTLQNKNNYYPMSSMGSTKLEI